MQPIHSIAQSAHTPNIFIEEGHTSMPNDNESKENIPIEIWEMIFTFAFYSAAEPYIWETSALTLTHLKSVNHLFRDLFENLLSMEANKDIKSEFERQIYFFTREKDLKRKLKVLDEQNYFYKFFADEEKYNHLIELHKDIKAKIKYEEILSKFRNISQELLEMERSSSDTEDIIKKKEGKLLKITSNLLTMLDELVDAKKNFYTKHYNKIITEMNIIKSKVELQLSQIAEAR